MSEEEINRKLEFIIDQQAQFVADIQSMRAVQAADSAFMRESSHTLTGEVTTIMDLVGKLAQHRNALMQSSLSWLPELTLSSRAYRGVGAN